MTRTYLVVFAKCTGSNFSGHAPDVPGCVATGDTLEEMMAMMKEALEFHLEGMAEHRQEAPEATTVKVDFLPEDFEDVEYFVVQNLSVKLPVQQHQTANADQAA